MKITVTKLEGTATLYETTYKSVPFLVQVTSEGSYPRVFSSRLNKTFSTGHIYPELGRVYTYVTTVGTYTGICSKDNCITLDLTDIARLDRYLNSMSILDHLRGFNDLKNKASKSRG